MKRACAFIAADNTIANALRGFFGRDAFHLSLGCGPFQFDPAPSVDIIVPPGEFDPGLYRHSEAYAKGALSSHEHLVILLDADWDGSPGAPAIRGEIEEACTRVGWAAEARCVVVLDPEVESWIWQDSVHVEAAVGHSRPPTLRNELQSEGFWPADRVKPPRPKEALERVLRKNRVPWSSSVHSAITSRISVGGCTDPAFQHMVGHLRSWFPPG